MTRILALLVGCLMFPMIAAAQGQAIKYTLPEGWTESKEARPMRHVTILTPEKTEVVITVFPGDVGGTLANLNRWRGQVGLAPIGDADVEKNVTQLKTADGANVMTVDFAGDKGRILAAIVPQGERTWFIRSLGQSEPIGMTKEKFNAFVKSVKTK